MNNLSKEKGLAHVLSIAQPVTPNKYNNSNNGNNSYKLDIKSFTCIIIFNQRDLVITSTSVFLLSNWSLDRVCVFNISKKTQLVSGQLGFQLRAAEFKIQTIYHHAVLQWTPRRTSPSTCHHYQLKHRFWVRNSDIFGIGKKNEQLKIIKENAMMWHTLTIVFYWFQTQSSRMHHCWNSATE